MLAIRTIALLMPILAADALSGQSAWIDAEIPGKVINIQQVTSSPSNDRVYFAGMIRLDSTNWTNTNPVLRYVDGGWDTLGVLRGMVRTMVEYHDTLIASGEYDVVGDSSPVEHITFWDGDHWEPYGAFQMNGARKLRVLDDTLYAVGSMDTADGQLVNGIARRIGGHWEPVGELDPDLGSIMVDIVKHDEKLVMIGSGSVFHMVNGVWSVLGGGIQGGLCSPHCVTVYQGDLYVGGQITMACGNPGQGILRWDGTAYQPLGLGLQYALGDNSTFSGAYSMVEHNGLLYVGGGFRYAGGVEAYGIATWDGIEWCGVNGNFTNGLGHNGVKNMSFYHDTLFVAANMVDGDSVNFACKFIGTDYQDACTGPLAITSSHSTGSGYQIFTEPGSIRVDLPTGVPRSGNLLDATGRIVSVRSGKTFSFPTAGFSPGIYIVRIEGFPPHRVFVP